MVAAGVQQNEKEKAAGVTPQLVAVDEERKLDGGCSPVKQARTARQRSWRRRRLEGDARVRVSLTREISAWSFKPPDCCMF